MLMSYLWSVVLISILWIVGFLIDLCIVMVVEDRVIFRRIVVL